MAVATHTPRNVRSATLADELRRYSAEYDRTCAMLRQEMVANHPVKLPTLTEALADGLRRSAVLRLAAERLAR